MTAAGLPTVFGLQQPLPHNLARQAYAAWRETLGNEVAAAAATPATQVRPPAHPHNMPSRPRTNTACPAQQHCMPRQLHALFDNASWHVS